MDDLKKLSQEITKYTLLLFLPVVSIITLVFGWRSGIGVSIGMVMGLVGFYSIVHYCSSIPSNSSAKRSGAFHYIVRYCFYGLVMGIFAYLHIPVLAQLAGFLCSKGAILIVSSKLGKEIDHVSSE